MRADWQTGRLADELIAYGADMVYQAHHQLLESYSADAYMKVIARLAEEKHPAVFLIGGTDLGRDLAPGLAARMRTGLTVDCTSFKLDKKTGQLCRIRPAFGSRLMAEIYSKNGNVQMCTIRPGMCERAVEDRNRSGEVSQVPVILRDSDIRTKMLHSFQEEIESSALLSANVVVAGGMGIGSREGFVLLEHLAKELHGAVGGTRAAVSAGFIAPEHMIGQTGLIIAPDLYIAFGISGAVQHMLGFSGAKCTVAINSDPAAPIFKEADYGIVADYKEFIPQLIRFLRMKETFV